MCLKQLCFIWYCRILVVLYCIIPWSIRPTYSWRHQTWIRWTFVKDFIEMNSDNSLISTMHLLNKKSDQLIAFWMTVMLRSSIFYRQEYHSIRIKSISKSDFDKGFALFENYLRCVFHFMIQKSILSYLCHFRAKSGMNPILNIFFFFRCPQRQYILRLSRRWSKQSRVSTCGTGTWTSNIIMQTRITNTEIKIKKSI